jgi:hypothetical protein
MSLSWNLQKVNNYKKLYNGKGKLKEVTTGVIQACLAVKMRGITATNYMEFYERLCIYESHFGPFFFRTYESGNKKSLLTLKVIKKYIGIITNVQTWTRTSWRNQLARKIYDDIESKVKIAIKQEIEEEKKHDQS